MREMQTESERAGDNTSRMLNNNGQLKSVGPRIDSPQTSSMCSFFKIFIPSVTVEEVGMVWESDFGKTFPNFKCVPWFLV